VLINSVPIIAGPIVAHLGWKYLFYISFPLLVIQWILLILFASESCYRRSGLYDIDTSSEVNFGQLAKAEDRARHRELEEDQEKQGTTRVLTNASETRIPPRKTFLQNMAVYTGSYSQDSVFKTIISTILILTNLSCAWAIFLTGLVVAWYVGVSVVSAELFSAPPYHFTAAGVGYTATGPLVGGLIGSILCSLSFDPFQKFMTSMNKGVQ